MSPFLSFECTRFLMLTGISTYIIELSILIQNGMVALKNRRGLNSEKLFKAPLKDYSEKLIVWNGEDSLMVLILIAKMFIMILQSPGL